MHTLLLNADYKPLQAISWKRAICLWYDDKVDIIEEYEDVNISSVNFSMKCPAVVKLNTYKKNKQSNKVKFSRYNVFYRDNFQCFTAGTLILKSNGEQIPIETIKIGDRVIDAFGNVQTVVNKGCKIVNEILKIKTRGSYYQTEVTPEHPFLNKNKEFVPIDSKPDHLTFPRNITYERSNSLYNVLDIIPKDRWFLLKNDKIYWSKHTKHKGFPIKLESSEDLSYLLGLYVAEGSSNPKTGLVTWGFHLKEEKTLAADVVKLVKKLFGLKAVLQNYPKRNLSVIRVSNKILSLVLRDLCGLSNNKKTPWSILGRHTKPYLKGLFFGDACFHKNDTKIVLQLISKDVILGAQSLLWEEKIYPTLQFAHRIKENRKPTWTIVLQAKNYDNFLKNVLDINHNFSSEGIYGNDEFIFRKLQNVEIINKEVLVYNLETTGSHSYIANGLAVHNCQYCYQEFPTNNLTFDHVIPRAHGGKTEWTNIVTACHPCNSKKANKLLSEIDMKLLKAPKEPKVYEIKHGSFFYKAPDIWKNYLF